MDREWAAYAVSIALMILILWAMLSLMTAIRRDMQAETDIDAARFSHLAEAQYSASDIYRAGSEAYWQAVSASRRHTKKLADILRRANRLIHYSLVLLGVLALLLFLLT